MGRPRTPTKLLKIRGSFVKHPEREREREGEPDLPLGVGEPHASLDASQRECWFELALKGAAWLTLADTPLLETAAKLMAAARRNELDTPAGKRYDKVLVDLGFGPLVRTRLKVPKHVDSDEKALLA